MINNKYTTIDLTLALIQSMRSGGYSSVIRDLSTFPHEKPTAKRARSGGATRNFHADVICIPSDRTLGIVYRSGERSKTRVLSIV